MTRAKAWVAVDAGKQHHWAVNRARGYSAPLLTALWDHCQQAVYVPGRAVNRASESYRGEGKTGA